jgi:CHAT domain-containing protein/tetratricopeptide (TPR) repeat protein
MQLRFHAQSSKPNHTTFHRGLSLLISILLLGSTIAAQDTRKTQEDAAARLMSEGLQLVAEGSPTSLPKAIDKLESARVLLHSLNFPEGEAVILILTGYAYSQLRQDQKAIEQLEQSVSLFRAAGKPRGEALALLHLGQLQGMRGDMQKALDNLTHALAQCRAAGDRQGEMIALVTLAGLQMVLGKPDEMVSYYAQVLEISRETASRESVAGALPALGPLYDVMGQNVMDQPQKGREGLEQILAVSRSLRIPRGEALALLMLGLYYSFELETQKALGYYEQSLPLFRAENDRFGEGTALFGVCMSRISSRDQKAFDDCAQALTIQRATGNNEAEALTLKQIAIGENDRGNLAASQTAIESAIAIVESHRTKVINPELRLSYFEGAQHYYDFYLELLMRLHRQHPNEGYDGRALEVSERARARSLLETLKEANADIRQGVDAALLEREREIQRRLNARAEAQMQLFSQRYSETQAKKMAEEIQRLIEELQQVETEIRQRNPRYAALMQPRPLTLKEIQTQVLDPDTLLLEYSLGEERSYVWAVTSSSITTHEIPKRAEIETAARCFYDLLNARNTRIKGETDGERAVRTAKSDAEIPVAAAALSRMVLAPVAGQLGNRRLIIVADDVLHFVPFGALPVASGGASSTNRQRRVTRPLIENHEIVNLPSASTLAVIRGEAAGRNRAPKSVVALADPVFMKDDERVQTGRDKDTLNEVLKTVNEALMSGESKDRQLVKATEDTGVASNGLYVPRLPGTRHEAEQIVAMVPTIERRLALDFAASRDTVTSAELSQYRYVHLSTHGLLNSVHPELSGLVFSLVNERGESQDGFLRAHEIFNLKLSPEVVVLSACQTGLGKNIRGEGLVSLTRGFMYAGAPRVIVSLWGVSDLGTTELMVRFYHGMLKEGMRPAAALRAAQVSLMNDKRWASPYYWAPFTLQGEWR